MKMENPFFRGDPPVMPSLNRVRIMDLPGVDLPTHVRGKTGFELLSAASLRALIEARQEELGLAADTPDLIRTFIQDGLLSGEGRVREAAEAITAEFGRRLGYLLLALRRGDGVNRAARPEWDERHWGWWRPIRTVWLGGGLVSGGFGRAMLPYTQGVLAEAGYDDYQLEIAPQPAALPLYGAARYAPAEAGVGLVFDFGGTWVKRGWAVYDEGELVRLMRLPAVPVPCSLASLEKQREAMVALMVETWREGWPASEDAGLLKGRRGGEEAAVLIASLACYLHEGQPYLSEGGCYGRLQGLAENLEAHLAEKVGQRLGCPVHLRLLHDGSAAAAAYAGAEKTAVIMLGTALGVGFPPTEEGLRPVMAYSAVGEGGSFPRREAAYHKLEDYKQRLDNIEKRYGQNSRVFALKADAIGRIYDLLGKDEEAKRYFALAAKAGLSILDKQLSQTSRPDHRGDTFIEIARFLWRAQDALAEHYFQQALDSYQQGYDWDNEGIRHRCWLHSIYCHLFIGSFDGAIETARTTYQIEQEGQLVYVGQPTSMLLDVALNCQIGTPQAVAHALSLVEIYYEEIKITPLSVGNMPPFVDVHELVKRKLKDG